MPTGGEVVLLGMRDELLSVRAKLLGARQRRRDLLVIEQGKGKALDERLALSRDPSELASCLTVSHVASPPLAARVIGGLLGAGQRRDAEGNQVHPERETHLLEDLLDLVQ